MTGTTIRVARSIHDALGRIAAQRGESLTKTIAGSVRLLQHEAIGHDLAQPLRREEHDWLDADTR